MLKALIATDGSPSSERALAMGCTLLAGKEVEVTVLHVIPRHLIYGPRAVVVAESYDVEEARRDSLALLEASAQKLRDGGVGPTISKELETGDPADLILAAAEQNQSDLIILGSRGLNATERFLLGSVSSKVSSHAPCAVLVVHAPQHATSTQAQA